MDNGGTRLPHAGAQSALSHDPMVHSATLSLQRLTQRFPLGSGRSFQSSFENKGHYVLLLPLPQIQRLPLIFLTCYKNQCFCSRHIWRGRVALARGAKHLHRKVCVRNLTKMIPCSETDRNKIPSFRGACQLAQLFKHLGGKTWSSTGDQGSIPSSKSPEGSLSQPKEIIKNP